MRIKARTAATSLSESTKSGLTSLKLYSMEQCNVMRESIRTFHISNLIQDPYPFILLWLLGSVVAIVLPRKHFNTAKQEYYTTYGYQVEYENTQRAYEEAQKNNNGDDGGNGKNYYFYYNGSYQTYPTDCAWYAFSCRRKQYQFLQYMSNNNNGGDNGEEDIAVPSWYRFIGGTTEEDERRYEELGIYDTNSTQSSGALKFVYTWIVIMFVGIVASGMFLLVKQQSTVALRVALFLYLQFFLIVIISIGQGTIRTDNRDLEDSIYGFYGQLGILIVYTCFSFLIYCAAALVALQLRAIVLYCYHKRNNTTNNNALHSVPKDNQNDDYENPTYVTETVNENNNNTTTNSSYRRMADTNTSSSVKLIHPPIVKGSMA